MSVIFPRITSTLGENAATSDEDRPEITGDNFFSYVLNFNLQ